MWHRGLYLKYLIFFATYNRLNELVFVPFKPSQSCVMLRYPIGPIFNLTKKMKCCEYDTRPEGNFSLLPGGSSRPDRLHFGSICLRQDQKRISGSQRFLLRLLRRLQFHRDSGGWGQCYKTFYGCKLRLFKNKLFQPSLMFAGKAGAYPSESPFRCSSLV
jgi:hypothetical protein